MKYINYLTIAFFLSGIAAHAQEVISTAGNNAESATVSMSWTIGEGVIETYTGTNNILTQGVYQTKLIVTDESPGSDYKITVFPNPVKNFVTIKIECEKFENFRYILYDSEGRTLTQEPLKENETTIDTQSLIPSSYILKVTDTKKIVKTFKVIKQ